VLEAGYESQAMASHVKLMS